MRPKTARPFARLTDATQPWYRINAAARPGVAEVFIMDEIGWFGVSAADFVRELNAITADQIDVHIASPGGDVFDAVAIFQALRNHKAAITTYVDSLAASAASFIALAGDKRIVAPYGSMMIHEAWGMSVGNASDMAKMSAELEKVSATLAQIYADRAGGKPAAWRALMHDETWFNATEAVEAGLMHEVQKDAEKQPASEAKNRWDLSVFAYAGREQAPAPRLSALVRDPKSIDFEPTDATPAVAAAVHPEPTAPADVTPDVPATSVEPELPAAEPERTTPVTEPNEEDHVSDLSEFRSRLGLDDDADEAAILAALDERLKPTEPTPTPTPEPVPAPEPAPTQPAPAPAPQPAAKADNPFADELARVSAELAEIRAKEAATVKAQVLDGAVKAGKIKPADKANWSNRYDKAPDVITEVLASIAAGTEVPTGAVGYTGDPDVDGKDTIDVEYERLFGAEKAGK